MSEDTTVSKNSSADAALRANLAEIRARVDAACSRAGRSVEDVTLVAVSKTHSVEAIRALYDAGQRVFGESYVQEWQEKRELLEGAGCGDVVWHFIGHLQSNKAKYLADEVALIHSVDRKSVLKRLQKRSREPVDVLLQVNVGNQSTKGGVASNAVIDLIKTAREFADIRVCGLMCIPPYVSNPEDNRGHFRQMRQTFERAREWLGAQEDGDEASANFRHLSMGMSGDFEVAIEEGATHVRVGTALFGARDYDN